MAGSFNNNKDSVDISELAALNNDISEDFINQLQNQLTEQIQPSQSEAENGSNDAALFEETAEKTEEAGTDQQEANAENSEVADTAAGENTTEGKKVEVNKSFDDNFIKKYKAKLQKKAQEKRGPISYGGVAPGTESESPEGAPIESLSQGNITERPLTEELKNYNDSLDFLDGNIKYSKYVIYIDPENVNFIEGLTVKERKNLINNILHQQNDIAMTKQRFKVIQTVLRHVIILILTIAIAIPVIYHIINFSIEATINNHRSAQTNWQTLYREHGKITKN